jgi:hypothetical protein
MLVRRILRQLLGVLVAVVGGWLVGIAFEFCWTLFDMVVHPGDTPPIALFVRPWIIALGSVVFILPVVPILIPMYLFLPRGLIVWRWPVCTVLGALGGILIVCAFFSRPDANPPESKLSWYVLATVIGGATCLIGSVTRNRFGGDTLASNQSLEPTAGRRDAHI